jgi:hypothetical protein
MAVSEELGFGGALTEAVYREAESRMKQNREVVYKGYRIVTQDGYRWQVFRPNSSAPLPWAGKTEFGLAVAKAIVDYDLKS